MAQGFTRFRKIQVGKQTVLGTAVSATRVLPYRSLAVYNTNRTDPDVDVGSLDPILAPYQLAPEITVPGATGPLTFNDLAYRASAGIKGGVTPTGNAVAGYTWTFTPAALTADTFDYYSVQTGDDTSDSAGAGTNAFGCVINQLAQSFGEDLGPWEVSDDWIGAGAVYGNRTAALVVDPQPRFAFGADTAVYLDSVAGAIGATQITAAVRGASLTINNNIDIKRTADGSNTRFQASGFGRGPRELEFKLTVEKTTQTIAEAVTFDDSPTPNRYIKVSTNSTETASAGSGGSKAYAEWYLPVRLYNVEDGEIGSNANYTFTYRGFYDSTLTYPFKLVILNSLSTL